jgi:hypothetical protein
LTLVVKKKAPDDANGFQDKCDSTEIVRYCSKCDVATASTVNVAVHWKS